MQSIALGQTLAAMRYALGEFGPLEATFASNFDRVRITDIVAEHLFNIGTPARPWLGLNPTGATVEYNEFAFHKLRDGRFYSMNCTFDVLALQRQLAG